MGNIKIDTSAPYLKAMLASSFVKALSELPKEKVAHCWAPLQEAWDKRVELHAEACQELTRLFPNHVVDVGPSANEPEPAVEINAERGDDFEVDNDISAAADQEGFLNTVMEAISQAHRNVASALRTTSNSAGTSSGVSSS